MKSLVMSLAAFGALGCSLALADPALPLPPGGGGEGVVVLSAAELDTVHGGAAPAGYRLNSRSVDYYTETREEYDPETETWNTVQGDTYKTTTRSSYQETKQGPKSSYSTTTRVVRKP
jgi:hypothetical protein